MTADIIPFPVKSKRGVRRSSSLRGFRVCTGEPAKTKRMSDAKIDEILGFSWTAPLVIEFDDPRQDGRREIHIRYLVHDGRLWKEAWMNRTLAPGKVRCGLHPAA